MSEPACVNYMSFAIYTEPSLGIDQVRLAYVLCKDDLRRAIMILAKAIEEYKVIEEQ